MTTACGVFPDAAGAGPAAALLPRPPLRFISMTLERAALCDPFLAALPGVASARIGSERERLCPDAMLDECRLGTCMADQRAQLSPGCRRIFDHGGRT